MTGVVKVVVPGDNNTPPEGSVYQSVVQFGGTLVTDMLTVPVPQREPSIAVDATGNEYTVTVTSEQPVL